MTHSQYLAINDRMDRLSIRLKAIEDHMASVAPLHVRELRLRQHLIRLELAEIALDKKAERIKRGVRRPLKRTR